MAQLAKMYLYAHNLSLIPTQGALLILPHLFPSCFLSSSLTILFQINANMPPKIFQFSIFSFSTFPGHSEWFQLNMYLQNTMYEFSRFYVRVVQNNCICKNCNCKNNFCFKYHVACVFPIQMCLMLQNYQQKGLKYSHIIFPMHTELVFYRDAHSPCLSLLNLSGHL